MSKKHFSRHLPHDIGPIHITGIGGIGMSGLAEVLHNLGYMIQGSDLVESANSARLQGMGIRVQIGQIKENVQNASVLVRSSAVPDTNPEVIGARELGIPVLSRAELLKEITSLKTTIAVAGTHGKTTTTSMVATILDAGGFDPTVINGGIINAYGTNARLGKSEWLVVEADESDGTFITFTSQIGIVTNIDPEHLEHYGSFEGVKAAFKTFISNIPFYGFAVCCKDHPVVADVIATLQDRRILTYGLEHKDVDLYATNITFSKDGSCCDVVLSSRLGGQLGVLKQFRLPVPGKHNIANALAALAIGLELGLSEDVLRSAFAGFSGVKRRFTRTGEVAGITIIDDYGHHPKEIEATLSAARNIVDATGGRIIAVVQPHRYSRVHDLLKEFATCFSHADIVLVSEIYAAGEQPIAGISREALVEAIKEAGHHDVHALESPEHLAGLIAVLAKPLDFVICLGAGSVTYWAHALPAALDKIYSDDGHYQHRQIVGS